MGDIFVMFIYYVSFLWSAVPTSYAFHLPTSHHKFVLPRERSVPFDGRHHLHHRLRSHSDSDSPSDTNDDDVRDETTPAQDIRSFLTQRCIQSFMYLLASTRDLHTVCWLDDIVRPITINNYWDDDSVPKNGAGDIFRKQDSKLGSKLLNYHGLSALNTTMYPEWDSFFTTLLEQHDTVLLIKTPEEMGQRAYSQFDIDIEPARLCTRILSVREQIARELAKDLKAIATMGQSIFTSYYQNSKDRKDKKQTKGSGTGPISGPISSPIEARSSGGDKETVPCAFDRPSTFYINFDPTDDDAFAPSPLRKGNFDLLYNLITQAAIIELLDSEDGVVVGEEVLQNKACQLFLSKFYEERLLTHFIGSQWYSKGDDFIEMLMLGSPLVMSRNEGGQKNDDEESDESKASVTPPLEIEPLRIAEQILLKRDKLALEWMKIMENIPTDHTDIRKAQLDRLTGVPVAEPTKITFEDEFQ